MPNLNRIRGRGGGFGYRGGIARNSGIPGATANRGSSATSYGLSKIHNSDTRIGTQGSANSTRMLPPNAIPRVGRNTQYRPQGNVTSRQSKASEGKIEVRNCLNCTYTQYESIKHFLLQHTLILILHSFRVTKR